MASQSHAWLGVAVAGRLAIAEFSYHRPLSGLQLPSRSHERRPVDEIVSMLTGNMEKIAEHGRRADGIVKSMLALLMLLPMLKR
jgi:hypothetical protein